MKCNNRTLFFVESILQLTKLYFFNTEQKYWNYLIKQKRIISIFTLNISLFCNGNLFFNKRKIYFFSDIKGICLIYYVIR